MTQFPVRPSEALALVVEPTDSLAVGLLKVLKMLILFYKVVKYFIDPYTLLPSAKFCADLRTIQCPDIEEEE